MLATFAESFRMVPLGDVLVERREEPCREDLASGEQQIISKIRFADGGIELRKGSASKTNLISIHPGDIVLSGINASKGAIALYQKENGKKLAATIHYSTYQVNEKLASPRYLWILLRSSLFHHILATAVPKGIKTELKDNRFLPIEVPLPPITEQRKVLKRLDKVDGMIREAMGLRDRAVRLRKNLLASAIDTILLNCEVNATLETLLNGNPRNGWSPRCNDNPDGTPVLSLSAVTGFEYDAASFKRTSLTTREDAHYWLTSGDFLITRSNTRELVGHCAIYDGNPSPCIYSDLMMRLPLDTSKVVPEFLLYWMQTSIVRSFIMDRASGTSPTMKKINQTIVKNIPVPGDVPLPKQIALSSKIRELKKRHAILVRLQENTVPDLIAIEESAKIRMLKGSNV